jgi:general secretion pathway protein J
MYGRRRFFGRREAGLTLIELVVAIALLAIMTVMAYRALDSISRAGDRTKEQSERWRDITMFFERFGADVGQAVSRPIRAGDGTLVAEWIAQPAAMLPTDAGDDKVSAQLEFTRKSSPGRDEIRIGFRLNKGRIELLNWHVLDRAPSSTADVVPLLDGVKTMHLGFLDKIGAWHENWPIGDVTQPLPRAVAIELTLADDTVLNRVFALP